MIKKFKDFLLENLKTYIPLPEDIINIANLFHSAGKDLFIVGGSVRDFLQGKTPHDYDLVTNALPFESKNILKNGNFNVSDEQGKKFGVLRIYTKDEPNGYELATYRKDISGGRDTKGDNEKVKIGKNITINDDCLRRDFTINALYYDINKKEIIDLVGGIDDIKNNIIRAVGDPSQRFGEDRLRLCRLFRFAARYNSNIDTKIINAIMRDKRLRNVSPIDDVSQERIVEEFVKAVDWSAEHENMKALNFYLELLQKYDMFEEMFPELNINIDNINTFNLKVIFALLFRDNNIENLRSKLRKYKFPNILADTACFLLRLRDELTNLNKIPALYKEKVRFHVDNETINEFGNLYDLDEKYLEAFVKFQPRIDANQLMKLGYKGPEIGAEVKRREIEEFKKLL